MRSIDIPVRCAVAAAAFVVLSVPGAARAGWTLTSNGIGQDSGIMDVSTPDESTCYAAGIHYTGSDQETSVWATTDGGASWTRTKPSTNPIAFYVSVFSPSSRKAYVGATRFVYITTDGGLTWTPSGDAGVMTLVSGVGGHGEDLVVAVAADGAIYRSETGGTSWTAVENPIGAPLVKVVFLDDTYGWLLGGTWDEDAGAYHEGALLRTTDGGLTWEAVFSGEPRGIQAVSFINPNEGWMVSTSASGAQLSKTTDGGLTWTEQDVPGFSAGPVNAAMDVDFFDRCEGWLILGTGEEQITTGMFYTSDGGSTWTEWGMSWAMVDVPLPIPVRGQPVVMDFSDRAHGYTGGFYEILGRYTADLPDPDCGGDDLDGWTDPDATGATGGSTSGCGCSIVW